MIRNSRNKGIKIIAVISGFTDLINMYGKENAEIIKMCFDNTIYLLSNDIYTLNEISNLCGRTQNDKNGIVPLITVEQLKTLQYFEAIILITRMMPIRTKLVPDYEIDWGLERKEQDFIERKPNKISTFQI